MSRLVCGFIVLISIAVLFSSGCCNDQYNKCVLRNAHCNERLQELLAQQEGQSLAAQQWQQKADHLLTLRQADDQKIKALLSSLDAKNALINQLSEQVGKVALPVELSNALAEWARKSGSDLVTYDEENGIVRFESDLLFNKGEDTVQDKAQSQLIELSKILNSQAAQQFDILIVGHTDDIPILKPDTRLKHPSNWHLSAHRAIAVEKIMTQAEVIPTRIAVVGMGEYRPIEPNQPGNKGNPKNRRVEIYIVPAGRIHIAG